MGIFTKEEIRALIISIFVLGIVFGLDDKREVFQFSYWVLNFLRVLIIVSIILVLREHVRKIIAGKFYAETEYRIWGITRIGFGKGAKLPIKLFRFEVKSIWLGVILPLLVSIVSFGKAYFPVVGMFDVKGDVVKRIGRRFIKLTEFETALIALSGIIVNIILVLFFSIFNKFINFNQFISINMWIAMFSFLPLGNLDGSKIFFNSILLYILSLAFTIFIFILIPYLGLVSTIILSIIFALIATFAYFKLFEYK